MSTNAEEFRPLHLDREWQCSKCAAELSSGSDVLWNPRNREVICLSHLDEGKSLIDGQNSDGSAIENIENEKSFFRGEPGGSAREKYEYLVSRRRECITSNHSKIGRLLLAISPEPQSTNAWARGAKGEAGIGDRLELLAAKYGFIVLHDRRIPGSKANIDHIAVTSTGIFVIDAKNYKGVVKVKELGGIFSTQRKELWIGGRNRSNLIDGVKWQTRVVERVLSSNENEMPVTGILAFYYAQWDTYKWFLDQKEIRGVLINSKGVEPILSREGLYGPAQREEVAHFLATKLKPAVSHGRAPGDGTIRK